MTPRLRVEPYSYHLMDGEVDRRGPWGLLDAWHHPGVSSSPELTAFIARADVWIHGNGARYYVLDREGNPFMLTATPTPCCTCRQAPDDVNCIHERLVAVLREARRWR